MAEPRAQQAGAHAVQGQAHRYLHTAVPSQPVLFMRLLSLHRIFVHTAVRCGHGAYLCTVYRGNHVLRPKGGLPSTNPAAPVLQPLLYRAWDGIRCAIGPDVPACGGRGAPPEARLVAARADEANADIPVPVGHLQRPTHLQ